MELSDYARIFRRRWRSIALLVVLGLVAGLGYTLATPKVYAAQSKVFVSLARVNPVSAYQALQFVTNQMPSYAQLNGSPQVLDPVIAKLGLDESAQHLASRVTVSYPAATVYLDVDVTAGSPAKAKRLANASASELATVIEGLQTTETSTKLVTARTQSATGSNAAVSPKLSLDLGLGFVVGLILGLILAIVRNRMDTSIRNDDDLRALTGVPPLADLPPSTGGMTDDDELSRRRLSAYRGLRTDLALASGGHLPPSVVVVTVDSADAADGSDVAFGLARVAARSGIRTCLVEADLRRPRLAAILSSGEMTGLTAVLEGDADLSDVVVAWPVDPAREPAVLVAGRSADDPSDLLDSAAMTRTQRVLAASFDLVVYSCPPASDGSDAVILARDCAATVMVAQSGSTARSDFVSTAQAVAAVGASVAGAVLVEATHGVFARRRARKQAAGADEPAPLSSSRPTPVELDEPSAPFVPSSANGFVVPTATGAYQIANAEHVPVTAVGLPPRARSSRSRRATTGATPEQVEQPGNTDSDVDDVTPDPDLVGSASSSP